MSPRRHLEVIRLTDAQATQLAAEIALVHAMDDWHRKQGHVLCWCNRWVHPDDLVENTCGGSQCLRAENDDRKGLVP